MNTSLFVTNLPAFFAMSGTFAVIMFIGGVLLPELKSLPSRLVFTVAAGFTLIGVLNLIGDPHPSLLDYLIWAVAGLLGGLVGMRVARWLMTA